MRRREPAVAGSFYPAEPDRLRTSLTELLDDARAHRAGTDVITPKAIIAPHAGYAYSGPVAASAYAAVAPLHDVVQRVVLFGPAHRAPLEGLAVPSVDAFITPLGPVEIDTHARETALACPGVSVDDIAHAAEHSLEVHLPFVQFVLRTDVRVLPVVVGRTSAQTIAAVVDALWGGRETLIVVSSDLSHYEPYEVAQRHDRHTAQAIVTGAIDAIGPRDACGAYPVRGLLVAAGRHRLGIQELDLRNSGDTAGPADRVVGYGAFALGARPSGTR